jgi:tRNA (cytidine/uridine-2'-O-)-methyltransferase
MTPATQTADPVDVERHVVLVAPDVHWNTGNVGRTCIGTNAHLHLIKPLGFSLDSRQVRRAGLDYWEQVNLSVWNTFTEFLDTLKPRPEDVLLFTKNGPRPFWEMPARKTMVLVFGSETRGLPNSVVTRYPDACYHIPTTRTIRSLNLSTAVGIALYESLRTSPPEHGWA